MNKSLLYSNDKDIKEKFNIYMCSCEEEEKEEEEKEEEEE